MDFELLAKSNRQEFFDAAHLERVLDAPVISPMVSTIMVAAPERIARLLFSNDPVVAAFADSCIIISDSDATPAVSGLIAPYTDSCKWQAVVTRLLETRDCETRVIRLSNEAAKIFSEFEQYVTKERARIPFEQGRFLDHLARQVVRCALNLRVSGGAPGGEIGADEVKGAIALGQVASKDRLALLNAGIERETASFRDRVLEIVSRAKVPPSPRDVCRHIFNSKLNDVMPVLDELAEAGTLEERDGRYVVAAASRLPVGAG